MGSLVATLAQIAVGIVILPLCMWMVSRPRPYLAGFVFALVVSGIYTINSSVFDIGLVLIGGIIGYLMRLSQFPFLPAVLGVVLGPMIEGNYRRSLLLSDGDHMVFIEDRIGLALLILAGIFVAISLYRNSPLQRQGRQGMSSEPVALTIGRFAAGAQDRPLPAPVRDMVRRLLVDVAGLCVAARGTDYVAACLASAEGSGASTALGHAGGRNAVDAALINGTAAHGEDFDDTFEGGPVHAGAPVVPAVLAVAERRGSAEPPRSPPSPSASR